MATVGIRELVALDRALAAGVTLTHNGKEWTFHPLTFRDMAELVKARKSESLGLLYEATKNGEVTTRERSQHVNMVLMRGAISDDFSFSDPAVLLRQVQLSLRHKHPDVTIDEVDGLLSDEAFREQVIMTIQGLSASSVNQDDNAAQGDGDDDPFGPKTGETSSADSSSDTNSG